MFARNRGLCPHKKNHPLGGWMIIVTNYTKEVSRTEKVTKLCYQTVNEALNTALSDHSILCREK